MPQAVVKYRDENGGAAATTRSFSTVSEAQAYAAGVVKDGFSAPPTAGQAGPEKFYSAETVSVVEVS